MNSEILVSVYMPTYYHEDYLEQAINSVLSQKMSFEYEIVISDDASKDNTQKIIKRFASQNKNIKYHFNESNIGLSNNMLQCKKMCCGKYIVGLAGDDYWIDELKLQKQVEFLEKNPEYFAVATRMEIRADNETTPLLIIPNNNVCEKRFTKEMFLKGANLPLNGIMVRNVMLDSELRTLFEKMPEISRYIDDLTDNLFILMAGDAYILDSPTVAYRTRVNNSTDNNFNSMNKGVLLYERHIDLLNNLDEYLKHSEDLFVRYKMIVSGGLTTSIKTRQFRKFYSKYNTIPRHYRKRLLLLTIVKELICTKIFRERKIW